MLQGAIYTLSLQDPVRFVFSDCYHFTPARPKRGGCETGPIVPDLSASESVTVGGAVSSMLRRNKRTTLASSTGTRSRPMHTNWGMHPGSGRTTPIRTRRTRTLISRSSSLTTISAIRTWTGILTSSNSMIRRSLFSVTPTRQEKQRRWTTLPATCKMSIRTRRSWSCRSAGPHSTFYPTMLSSGMQWAIAVSRPMMCPNVRTGGAGRSTCSVRHRSSSTRSSRI